MNNATYNRKLTTFRQRMQNKITLTTYSLINDPMGTGLKIPSDTPTETTPTVRLVRTKSTDENYTEGGAGFIADTFKWILSCDAIQEDSFFTLHDKTYYTGKCEQLIYQNKIYGYRIPVRVRN